MAIIDFFDRGWRIAPLKTAYFTDAESWTYDEAGTMSCRISHSILGLAPDRRRHNAAVLAPNSPLAWICVLGIWRAGSTYVPLNPGNSAAANADLIDRFDVDLLFYHPALSEQITEIRDIVGDKLLTMIALEGDMPDISLTDWTADQPNTPPHIAYAMDDTVMIAPTGGTTGSPKGVMNTHRSMSVMVAHQMLAFHYDEGESIVNLAAAPMTHSAGVLTLHATALGGRVMILPRATPENILPAIARYRVTEVFLPPTVIYRLLEVLEDTEVDTSSLRYLIYGAAPMSVEKLRRGIERLGPVFLECYGQTEAPAAIAFLRPSEHLLNGQIAPDGRLASCGHPYPLVDLAILDPTTGLPVESGETGEICVRGDLVMKGYYKDPEKTAEAIRDGWLHTGDLGHLDSEGYLHLTDRQKDIIITGGFNVYPVEVEQVIWAHPAVEDCAVVGAPDEDWGERVVAVVELKPGESVSAADLTTRCRDALGPVRTPKETIFVDRLPRSPNGKVLKKDIRATFWKDRPRTI